MLLLSKNIGRIAGKRYLFSKSKIPDNSYIKISEEVRFVLEYKKPIVALESTIITHGMPYPSNVQCALEVEKIIREEVKKTVKINTNKIF